MYAKPRKQRKLRVQSVGRHLRRVGSSQELTAPRRHKELGSGSTVSSLEPRCTPFLLQLLQSAGDYLRRPPGDCRQSPCAISRNLRLPGSERLQAPHPQASSMATVTPERTAPPPMARLAPYLQARGNPERSTCDGFGERPTPVATAVGRVAGAAAGIAWTGRIRLERCASGGLQNRGGDGNNRCGARDGDHQ